MGIEDQLELSDENESLHLLWYKIIIYILILHCDRIKTHLLNGGNFVYLKISIYVFCT